MSLTITVRGPATDWHALDTMTKKNLVGSAVTDEVVTYAGSGQQLPGVLKYRVIGVYQNYVDVTCDIILASDSKHPGIDLVGGGGTNLPVPQIVKATAQVGDEFIIARGYLWDEAQSIWLPVRAFGVLMPGSIGDTLSIGVANAGGPQIFAQFSWEDSGPNMFEARVNSGAWKRTEQSPLFLSDAQGVSGMIATDGTCTVDVRPAPAEGTDNQYNMVELVMTIMSYSV